MATEAQIYALCTYALCTYALYICREPSTNQLFYAKQTQFTGCPNERK